MHWRVDQNAMKVQRRVEMVYRRATTRTPRVLAAVSAIDPVLEVAPHYYIQETCWMPIAKILIER